MKAILPAGHISVAGQDQRVDPYCRLTGESEQRLFVVSDQDAEEANVGKDDFIGSLVPSSTRICSSRMGFALIGLAVSTSRACQTRCRNSATTALPSSPPSIAAHPTVSSSRTCSCTGGRCG